VLGTDGKLYAIGQHPSRAATAVQIDPDTLEVTAYGPIGPSHAPNACWGYSGGADDRFIYIASGKVPWYLVAYDRQTGTSRTLAETETFGGYVGVGQRHDGCTGQATKVVGSDGARQNYWLHEGQALPKPNDRNAPPPWPTRAAPARTPLPEINTGLVVPDTKGHAELWVRPPRPKSSPPEPQGASPEERGWRRFEFTVPLYPHTIYRLTELPDGRLFGTAGAYEGNFVYDPATGEARHLGKIHLSHYATTTCEGKVYMSGYPTSPLYVFDPGRPWTAGKLRNGRVVQDHDAAANPRMLLRLGDKKLAGTHKMYAAVTGSDGRVYFGGKWVRDGACGGLAWYDPRTAEAGGMWRPFSNHQVTHLATASKGRTVVISTRRVDDPILKKPKPAEGALFFLDVETRKLDGPLAPVPGATGAGPILPAGGSRIIGWTVDPEDERKSVLYVADAAERKLVFAKSLPCPLPVAIGSNQQEAWDFRLGPDGKVWTFLSGVLARIDRADGTVRIAGRPHRPGRIAFAHGRVYLGGTTALRRVDDLTIP
jgi:hypothetical protein